MPGENIWNPCHIQRRRAAYYDKIAEYYLDGTYSDVNIICQDRKFKCHRMTLAAASEYFHRMFGGDFAESRSKDVVLHDLDSVTFEQVLLLVYRGEIVAIDDNNVYNLLRASDILQLSELEYHCVHYLTQKNIPMDCAVDMYLFASVTRKLALIPAISRFILQHLDHFGYESEFLKMSFEDFSVLLTYFQPLSVSRDTELLNAIRRWVCHSTNVHENRKLSFMKLAEQVQFKSVSTELIAKYSNNISETTDVNSSSVVMNELRSLYVYMETDNLFSQTFLNHGFIETTQTSIFSLQESFREGISLKHSGDIKPSIGEMKMVESDDRLYYLKYHHHKQCHTFSSSTAFYLQANVQSLALPTLPIKWKISLCSLQKNIYLSNYNYEVYNTELGIWSTIPALSKYGQKNLVNDDARLYMTNMYGIKYHYIEPPFFAAYDPRDGKVQELNNEGLDSIPLCGNPGCYYKGKIYLIENIIRGEREFEFRMAAYDPAAGRWDVQNSKPDTATTGYMRLHQLVSFNDRLWLFGLDEHDEHNHDTSGHIYTQTYDSYLQEWNAGKLGYGDAFNNVLRDSNLRFLNVNNIIAFKS